MISPVDPSTTNIHKPQVFAIPNLPPGSLQFRLRLHLPQHSAAAPPRRRRGEGGGAADGQGQGQAAAGGGHGKARLLGKLEMWEGYGYIMDTLCIAIVGNILGIFRNHIADYTAQYSVKVSTNSS